jgi:hypothetical protein
MEIHGSLCAHFSGSLPVSCQNLLQTSDWKPFMKTTIMITTIITIAITIPTIPTPTLTSKIIICRSHHRLL